MDLAVGDGVDSVGVGVGTGVAGSVVGVVGCGMTGVGVSGVVGVVVVVDDDDNVVGSGAVVAADAPAGGADFWTAGSVACALETPAAAAEVRAIEMAQCPASPSEPRKANARIATKPMSRPQDDQVVARRRVRRRPESSTKTGVSSACLGR